MMLYAKPPLTHEEQATLLLSRGLVADRQLLEERLAAVNYYRLSGYLYPFRCPDDTYRAGTTLEEVWRRYTFDRRLRLLIMDPIERVEIAIRSLLVYEHAHEYGAFGYEKPETMPGLSLSEHSKFLRQLDRETNRSKEKFVQHFIEKYGDNHDRLPIWSAAEIMSLGATLTLYRGMELHFQGRLSARFGVAPTVMRSWIMTLHTIRNICAHHGRLWNRILGVRPMIPRKKHEHPEWHTPVAIPNDRVFAVLTILKYLTSKAAPQSLWYQRLRQLICEYPGIPISSMGFPENWQTYPIWSESEVAE